MTELVTKIKKVKGLGSAKDGTSHFLAQRVTGVALVGLVLWFMFSLTKIYGLEFLEIKAWVKNPVNAFLLITMFPILFYHSKLGFAEVVEDYVHNEFNKIFLLIAAKIFFFFLTVASVLAVLFINFK